MKASLAILALGLLGCINSPNKTKWKVPIGEKPVVFLEGLVSTEDDEFDVTFTKHNDTLFFTRRKAGEVQKIYFSIWKNHEWTVPTIAPFSTDRDEFPNLTRDGKTLYFGSTRSIQNRTSKGNFDMNIWKVEKKGAGWAAPSPLGPVLNKTQKVKEDWPSSNENSIFSIDDKTFLFSTMKRGDSTIHIYQTSLNNSGFSSPIKVNGLFDQDTYWKSSPVISPDGKYLFFNAYNTPYGFGGEDIYVCKVLENGFSKAINLGPNINSKREETAPKFSGDGSFFFFSRNEISSSKEDGDWNVYYIETKKLYLETLFKNHEK